MPPPPVGTTEHVMQNITSLNTVAAGMDGVVIVVR